MDGFGVYRDLARLLCQSQGADCDEGANQHRLPVSSSGLWFSEGLLAALVAYINVLWMSWYALVVPPSLRSRNLRYVPTAVMILLGQLLGFV